MYPHMATYDTCQMAEQYYHLKCTRASTASSQEQELEAIFKARIATVQLAETADQQLDDQQLAD